MRLFIPINKDTSIYEALPDVQTGIDEILEVGKTPAGITSIRSLVDFDIIEVQSKLARYVSASVVPSYDLQFYTAIAGRIVQGQTLLAYPLSQSWSDGQGYYFQDVQPDPLGATWKYRVSGSQWSVSGSTFLTDVSASAVFATQSDVIFDATALINYAVSTSQWNGVVIKYPDTDEQSESNTGNIRFFSSNTHTIFAPYVIIKFDDQQFTPVSSSLAAGAFSVLSQTLAPSYYKNEIVKVYLYPKQTLPQKTFDRVRTGAPKLHLPTTATFSVVDTAADITLIPHDEFSKVSTDADGSYIKFSTSTMNISRHYSITIKIDDVVYPVESTFTIRGIA